jgi:hypothetical protein
MRRNVLALACGLLGATAAVGCRQLLGIDDPVLLDAAGDAPVDAVTCADQDHDGACDPVDRCPGFDDRLDADGDGIPDGCDDWPCGARPVAPSPTVAADVLTGGKHATVTLRDTTVEGQALFVAAPGAPMKLATSYTIVDCICPNCIDQIEVGLAPGTRAGCIFDAKPGSTPTCATGSSATTTFALAAPTTPGLYEVRFNLGQAYTCDAHADWWNQPPTALATVALVCVR